MKLSLISYAQFETKEKHWNLILESVQDVQQYFEASSSLSAHQFIDVWEKMKGKNGFQQTWPHFFDQRTHQGSIAGALVSITMKAEQQGKVSLVEACEIHDKLLYVKLQNMLKIVIQGKSIRVASKGGYSIFDEFYQTHEQADCSEKDMREFLMSYDSVKMSLFFKRPIVVIENESVLSDRMSKHFRYIDNQTHHFVYNFKYRTENWTYEEFFKLFDEAVKNGTHTIMAETSLYDIKQFGALAKVAKNVMTANPTSKLTIKLLINGDVKDLTPYIAHLPDNLTVEVLN